MRKLPFLQPLLFMPLGTASAQSLSIGPGGISLSTGTTPDDVRVQLGQDGVQVTRATPMALPTRRPPPRYAPQPAIARYDCAGHNIELYSDYQIVTRTGGCPHVTVRGTGNTIYTSGNGPVQLLGSGNRVIRSGVTPISLRAVAPRTVTTRTTVTRSATTTQAPNRWTTTTTPLHRTPVSANPAEPQPSTPQPPTTAFRL